MFKDTQSSANYQGMSFQKVGRSRLVAFLIIHAFVLVGIFALKFFGFVTTDFILVIAGIAISLEAIYLSYFAMTRVNKTVEALKEIEKGFVQFRENALEIDKIHRALLYLGHQIKTIQIAKVSGNGHYKRTHSA